MLCTWRDARNGKAVGKFAPRGTRDFTIVVDDDKLRFIALFEINYKLKQRLRLITAVQQIAEVGLCAFHRNDDEPVARARAGHIKIRR